VCAAALLNEQLNHREQSQRIESNLILFSFEFFCKLKKNIFFERGRKVIIIYDCAAPYRKSYSDRSTPNMYKPLKTRGHTTPRKIIIFWTLFFTPFHTTTTRRHFDSVRMDHHIHTNPR
jgi:hypothetical protein